MLVRFERNGKIKHGWLVAEENKIRVIEGDIYKKEAAKPIMTGLEIAVSEVELLSPCTPSKVICIGGNEREKTDELLVYTKTPSSVIGSNQPIVCPAETENLHFEAKLAVVIKKDAFQIKAEEADDYILGFTCGIELSTKDSHVFDAFCPVGPAIAPKVDYNDLRILSTVNGEVRQDFNTKQMAFPIPVLLEAVTADLTLLAGDVVLIGSTVGAELIYPEDEITVSIEGIGTLTNRVVIA